MHLKFVNIFREIVEKFIVKMDQKIRVTEAKSFEDLDFDKIDLIRGKTPEDIKQKCFHLCKDYLEGVWLKVGIDEVEVKRLSGGMTNQLYYCAINKQIKSINDEPQEVIIRLYGGKHFNNYDCDGNERLTDVIIALLVSENKLGPKIYGLFESGQILEYIKVVKVLYISNVYFIACTFVLPIFSICK